MMGEEMLFPIQCNWWLDELGRNTIRERTEREPITNRPVLTYLKLLDDDGTYRIWTREEWSTWRIIDGQEEAEMTGTGENSLKDRRGDGLIPWVWFKNGESLIYRDMGISDIEDIALIDASIVRDCSNIDEVITNAAFPMLALPKERIVDGREEQEIEVGPTRILLFAPEQPGSRPFWLNPVVGETVNAALSLWDKKIAECYKMANLGGLREAEGSKQRWSGESMRESFRFLNASLSEKVDSEIESRLSVIKLWLMWQGKEDDFEEISIEHDKNFSAEELIGSLKEADSAVGLLPSEEWRREVYRKVVARALPDADPILIERILKEVQKKPGESRGKEKGNED
jgi:hypothetical protein